MHYVMSPLDLEEGKEYWGRSNTNGGIVIVTAQPPSEQCPHPYIVLPHILPHERWDFFGPIEEDRNHPNFIKLKADAIAGYIAS